MAKKKKKKSAEDLLYELPQHVIDDIIRQFRRGLNKRVLKIVDKKNNVIIELKIKGGSDA